MCVGLFSGCGEEKTTINVYNVGDYIDEEVISLFQEEYPNIRVNYETYYTNEEMYIKVKNNSSAYDIVFPSDYMVERMISEDMLNEINFENIPNYKNIGSQYKNLDYDPENVYSVPYMWGTMGIMYNKDMVDAEDVKSWHAIYDKKYEGEIFMLDSERDMISITLKSLGYSMNSSDDAELKKAEDALIKQKDLVKAYCGDEVKDKMIAGEGA
ncbi:MAG: spermidine/putrescine ABC transporter substrate-binding protein, partial [Clostridia bacterium]|nr:spermidine/putrescine ABC transporter substrate-binding protein [Clostridia bacterium]